MERKGNDKVWYVMLIDNNGNGGYEWQWIIAETKAKALAHALNQLEERGIDVDNLTIYIKEA